MTNWWASTGGNSIEKCVVRSEHHLSHTKVVFTRRLPLLHCAAMRSTEGCLTFTTRQVHGLPAQAGTKIITNKPTSRMNRYLLLVTSSAGTRFPRFWEIALPRGPLQLKGFSGWQIILQSILAIYAAGAQPFLVTLLTGIQRCANPATWVEENKKHACQYSSLLQINI